MGVLAMLAPGCGRNLDLVKIVTKNISYEIRHARGSPENVHRMKRFATEITEIIKNELQKTENYAKPEMLYLC